MKVVFAGIACLLKSVFIIGFIIFYLILELVKWIFTGEQKRVKILSTVLVGLVIATLAIYIPKILLAAVIVLAVVIVGYIIFYVCWTEGKPDCESKQENAGSNTENNTNRNTENNTNRNTNTEQRFARKSYQFFAGMTPDQAKKEYHRLMKQYHPDNLGGDLEMSQQISEEYRRFRAG